MASGSSGWEAFIKIHQLKPSIQHSMEYCCHISVGAPSYYLEMLYKLQKLICTAVGPSIAASFDLLAHHRNVALSLLCWYYFSRSSSKLAQLVPFPYSHGRSTHYCDILLDFSVTIPRCYKEVYVNSFMSKTLEFFSYRIFSFEHWYKWLQVYKSQKPLICMFSLKRFSLHFNVFVFLVTLCTFCTALIF